jgi:predicted GIY-YIG superfamily endonuclease
VRLIFLFVQRSSCLNKEKKPLGYVYIQYVKGVSEKFKRIGNRYNVRIFRTKHTLRNSLMKTRPNTDPQRTAECAYSIPCECGRIYIGETGRPLAVRLREHKHNFKEGLIEKSKLAQHAYEEDRKVMWDEARVLEVESNSRYRKYKESAHMACSTNPLANPVWIFLAFGSPLSVMR